MENTPNIFPVDKLELESQVKEMYTLVANDPFKDYHFEMGRKLALKLGYTANKLDNLPKEAIDSFAGVGYYFDLANVKTGEKILDLGSGSGMDLFYAAQETGQDGQIIGVDMTEAQLEKCRSLASSAKISNIELKKSYIEDLPFQDNTFDLVISNGVINLSVEKDKVFEEIARVLKSGGRMAISDIVSESQMPDSIVCNSNLWASCIGGATQIDKYKSYIEKAGLEISEMRDNPQYHFLTKGAQGAERDYGVKSTSVLAFKN